MNWRDSKGKVRTYYFLLISTIPTTNISNLPYIYFTVPYSRGFPIIYKFNTSEVQCISDGV